jgi:hypothetical protein
MENSFENIRFLAIKLVIGEELETDEEKEFYEENKIEINRLMSDYIDDEFPIENDFYDE